jgi:hypothetical protein
MTQDTKPDACPEEFFQAYITTALWSSNDESDERGGAPMDENYGPEDIDGDSLVEMRKDCDAFYAANYDDLNCEGVKYGPDFGQDGRAGHDFWLTRNRHGAGFWDGDWPEPQATVLTSAAHKFGECDLYVGNDEKIHLS